MTEPAPNPAPSPSPAPSPGPAPVAPSAPQGLEKYWDAQGGKLNTDALAKDFTELSGFKTAAEQAKAALPKDVSGYKVEFKAPKDFKLPEGVPEIKVDPKDPRIPVLLDFAHRRGLGQDAVDELVSATMIAEHAAYVDWDKAEKARVAEEHKKLGENADARKAAIESALTAWNKDHAAVLLANATDAAHIVALEALLNERTKIPGGGPSPEPPKPAQTVADRWYPPQQKAS